METVKLKNGSTEVSALVEVTMASLSSLIESAPIAFYELATVARNPVHQTFGNTGELLEERSLLSTGRMQDSIRNIILSAVAGNGLDMQLGSPVRVSTSRV